MECKALIDKESSLGKTIHPLADFDVDVAIVHEIFEIACVDYFWGDQRSGKVHICIAFHWCVQIKAFYIATHELGGWGGHDAVE
jgi:hypothetical protein